MIHTTPKLKGVASLYIQYNGSAALEKPQHRGLSHLWEHLACKTWEPAQNLFSKYSLDWNAFTSANRVVYHIHGLEDHIHEVCSKYVLGSKHNITSFVPTREQFEKERNVVVQEYDSSFSDRSSSLMENIARRVLGFWNPIGERRVLTETTYEQYLEFAARYATPSIVHFAGSKAPTFTVEDLNDPQHNIEDTHLRLYAGTGDMSLPIECNSYSSTETVMMDYIMCRAYTPELTQFLAALWSAGFDSPIVTEIRHKRGYAYSARIYAMTPEPMICTYITTGPENVADCRAVMQEMFRNPEQYITPERFRNVQDLLCNEIKLRNVNDSSVEYIKSLYSPHHLTEKLVRGFDYDKCLRVMHDWPSRIRTAHVGSEMVIE